MMKKCLQALCLTTAFAAALPMAHAADDVQKLDQRVDAASAVLHELMDTPDKGIPDGIARKAKCIAVVPAFKKGAFIVGGEYGQGVVSCRTHHGWSAPVFIQMSGGSFGFQVGGQSTDLVLLAMNHDGFEKLLHEKIKLGGDASVAAGPVGRAADASTSGLASAELLSYSRNRGVFAGIDLAGDEVNQNKDATRTYYGKDISYETILTGGVPVPAGSEHFVHNANKLFHADMQ